MTNAIIEAYEQALTNNCPYCHNGTLQPAGSLLVCPTCGGNVPNPGFDPETRPCGFKHGDPLPDEDEAPEITDEFVLSVCHAASPSNLTLVGSPRFERVKAALQAARLPTEDFWQQRYEQQHRTVHAMAEDPVREAAKELVDKFVRSGVMTHFSQSEVEVFNILREALTKPAPEHLTEDERKAVVEAMRIAGPPLITKDFESARKKLGG